MRKSLLFALFSVGALILLLSQAQSTSAAFHLMRVYNVMGGANGGSTIQFVELRMTDAGQTFVQNHDICFYDASGAAYARFRFSANVPSGADEASVLVGTSEFDAAWAAGSPNFTFSGANTTAIQGGADVDHPVRSPSGKIAFGTDGTAVPANMCQGSFSQIDSVAYGTTYTGTVDHGTKFNTNLPTSGTQSIRLQGPICIPASFFSPCPGPLDNSADYALVSTNGAGNQPRNNSGQVGPITVPDADGDGVSDASDLCAGTAPAAPVDASGCSQSQVDIDTDTICDPGAPSGGPNPCTGSDNCPNWPNTGQALPNWPIPVGDPDCDGFTITRELFVGTDPLRQCPLTTTLGDEATDGWPPDFNDNKQVTLSDVLQFSTPFNSSAPGPPYSVRLDLNNNGQITLSDVLQTSPFFNKSCT